MKILPVDLNNMEHCNFAGLEVDFLQLNGKELWNNVSEQVGLDLNYTGLDVNGNVEGSLKFDGTIVAYGVGKPTITYYKEVTPTPTTEEGYYGYYIANPYRLVDSSNFSSLSITVGTTQCYEITDSTSASDESIVYQNCNGYNSEYYNGYDFATSIAVEDIPYNENQRIVPEVLKIPNTYNEKPVTQVLQKAFYGGEVFADSTNGTNKLTAYNQGVFIKDIVWGNNLQTINPHAFYCLFNYGLLDNKTTFYVPAVSNILTGAFGYLGEFNDNLTMLVVPENAGGSLGPAFFQVFTGKKFSLVTYQCANVPNIVSCDTVVFEKTVKTLGFGGDYVDIPLNMKFMHENTDEITIVATSVKSAKSINIYTDNENIVSHNFGSYNYNATMYRLDGTLWTVLETPTIAINGKILTITPVENATRYKIFAVDGNTYTLLTEVSETTIDLSGVESDETLKIVVSAYNDNYAYSVYSNSVYLLFNQLEAPTITISSDGNYLTITPVENADTYKVYKKLGATFDPEDAATTITTSDTYISVEHLRDGVSWYLTAQAFDSTGTYVNSFESNAVLLPVWET